MEQEAKDRLDAILLAYRAACEAEDNDRVADTSWELAIVAQEPAIRPDNTDPDEIGTEWAIFLGMLDTLLEIEGFAQAMRWIDACRVVLPLL